MKFSGQGTQDANEGASGNGDPNEGALFFTHSSISRILKGVERNPLAGILEAQKAKISASVSDVIVSHSTAMTFSGQGTGMQMRAPSFFTRSSISGILQEVEKNPLAGI